MSFDVAVAAIFPGLASRFRSTTVADNPVTMSFRGGFSEFESRLLERFGRLALAYPTDSPGRAKVEACVFELAGRGWDGAYAELSAQDFFVAQFNPQMAS